MELIAHRGNTSGKNEEYENHPDYIEEAVNKGFSVEVDCWYCDWAIVDDKRKEYKTKRWMLGHDFPRFEIDFSFIRNLDNDVKLWCHSKNIETLFKLLACDINCFYHDRDRATLTSRAFIWTYPGARPLTEDSICVLPEEAPVKYMDKELRRCFGICSDYVEDYMRFLC